MMKHNLIALELNIFEKKLRQSYRQYYRNISKIQGHNSIMHGYFFIEFIDFMFKDKSLLDYANLFSPNE